MFTEDLTTFFSPDDFADKAIWNDATPVNGIFDDGYQETLGIASSGPSFMCASADVCGIKRDDMLLICKDTATYRVVNAEPDGTGITVLRLMKA